MHAKVSWHLNKVIIIIIAQFQIAAKTVNKCRWLDTDLECCDFRWLPLFLTKKIGLLHNRSEQIPLFSHFKFLLTWISLGSTRQLSGVEGHSWTHPCGYMKDTYWTCLQQTLLQLLEHEENYVDVHTLIKKIQSFRSITTNSN